MKHRIISFVFAVFLLMLISPFKSNAAGYLTKDSISAEGFTLITINKDSLISKKLISILEETFFKVYPRLAEKYNNQTAKRVIFVIEPAYNGVAATSNDRVVFNPRWFDHHPEDIDVVTHEVMHIVQAYGNTSGPGWLTEGIADYVRFKFGVNNQAAGWSLPDVKPTQNYTDSYRVTARFLVWLEQQKNPEAVILLDQIMRQHTYTDAVWEKLSGKDLSGLWKEYLSDPEIRI